MQDMERMDINHLEEDKRCHGKVGKRYEWENDGRAQRANKQIRIYLTSEQEERKWKLSKDNILYSSDLHHQ